MGACYFVEMKLKFKDKEGATEALKTYVHNFLADNPQCNFDGDESFDELLGFVLAAHQKDFYHIKKKYGKVDWYSSGFDASYGWSIVVDDAFATIVPYLEDGSTYRQDCDNEWDKIKVIGGKQIWYRSNHYDLTAPEEIPL